MPQPISLFFKKLLNLREGAEEKNVIIENVKDDADFSSARFWTLAERNLTSAILGRPTTR